MPWSNDTYTKPAGSLAVGNTTANSASFNTLINDLETGLDTFSRATQAEAEAGTDNSVGKYLTPLRGSQMLTSLAKSTYGFATQFKAAAAQGISTAASWQEMPYNTTLNNTLRGSKTITVSGTGVTVTLPLGTYYIYFWGRFYQVNDFAVRLYNVTDGSSAGFLCEGYAPSSSSQEARPFGFLELQSSDQKEYRVEYNVQTANATDGFGRENSISATETYAHWVIDQVSTS